MHEAGLASRPRAIARIRCFLLQGYQIPHVWHAVAANEVKKLELEGRCLKKCTKALPSDWEDDFEYSITMRGFLDDPVRTVGT